MIIIIYNNIFLNQKSELTEEDKLALQEKQKHSHFKSSGTGAINTKYSKSIRIMKIFKRYIVLYTYI